MIRKSFDCLLAAGLLVLSACAVPTSERTLAAGPAVADQRPGSMIAKVYDATDGLLGYLPGNLQPGAVVLVASLANIDDLEESSRFGRAVAEQVGSRLVQSGFVVREVKLADTLMVREHNGEFILSRDFANIANAHNADVVVTGTYSEAQLYMFVNLRMTRLVDGVVLAAHDFELVRDTDIITMTKRD